MLLEERCRAGIAVPSIEINWGVGPPFFQHECVPPRVDGIGQPPSTLFREHRVKLGERQSFDRIIFMHEDGQRIHGNGNLGWFIAELPLEFDDLLLRHASRHRGNLDFPL